MMGDVFQSDTRACRTGSLKLLHPYHSNVTKRLAKTPKPYFLDTGLCAYTCYLRALPVKRNIFFLYGSQRRNRPPLLWRSSISCVIGPLIALCILFTGYDTLLADQASLLPPPVIQHERVQYETLELRSQVKIRTVQTEINRIVDPVALSDLQRIKVTMKGAKARGVFESIFRITPDFSWIEMSRTKETVSGETVLSEHINNPPTNYFPRASCPMFALDYVLRGLMGNSEPYSQIITVVPGGILLDFAVKQKGTEEIVVPAGRFLCRKIVLVPKINRMVGLNIPLMGTLSRPFLPKATFWFDVAPPHLMVKKISVAGIPPNDEKIVDQLEEIFLVDKEASTDPSGGR